MSFIIAAAASLPAAAGDRESEFRGRRLAEANCAVCHAIAQVDRSENRDAPPFRHLSHIPSFKTLRKDLRGPLFLRHPQMPDFEPDRRQADDIVDFIESIQE
jgi:mono/diheme cytochrome c family protein